MIRPWEIEEMYTPPSAWTVIVASAILLLSIGWRLGRGGIESLKDKEDKGGG